MNKDVLNNNSLKEVVFIRHGKPLSAHNEKVNAVDYVKWVRNYNKSPLDPASQPKQVTHIKDSYIAVSPLLRARLTAAQYGVTSIDEELPYLKEMDIPYYKLPFILRSWHWVLLSRALWFLGTKGRFESFNFAKRRVEKLALYIDKLSQKHSRVVLFGHGMTNYYTRKALIKKGWQLKEKDSDFWGVTILQKVVSSNT